MSCKLLWKGEGRLWNAVLAKYGTPLPSPAFDQSWLSPTPSVELILEHNMHLYLNTCGIQCHYFCLNFGQKINTCAPFQCWYILDSIMQADSYSWCIVRLVRFRFCTQSIKSS